MHISHKLAVLSVHSIGYRYKGVYQNKDATYARDAEGNVMNDCER